MPKLKQSPISEASEIVMRNIYAQGKINGLYLDKQIAAKIGMTDSIFGYRKRYPRCWRIDEIVKAAIAFKCSLAWLVTDHRGEEQNHK